MVFIDDRMPWEISEEEWAAMHPAIDKNSAEYKEAQAEIEAIEARYAKLPKKTIEQIIAEAQV